MTGRGKTYYHRPSANPDVTVSLSLSISPAQYDPSSDLPLYLVVTARLLKSPRPESPITLATSLNPLDFISDRSFKNIKCVSSSSSATSPQPNPTPNPKHIEIWPKSHFAQLYYKNVRDCWRFVTINPNKPLEVRHEVPRDAIRAAGLQKGEKYRAEMTDMGLGTSWWMFGTLEDVEGLKFKRWSERHGVVSEMDEEEDNMEEEGGEGVDEVDDKAWVVSEDPSKFAFVVEKGDAEFDVV